MSRLAVAVVAAVAVCAPGPVVGAAPGAVVAADADGDQIPDASDACPLRPGLPPGGCPPSDADGDRVLDRDDRCPDTPGPMANRGCPDTDRDTDGVVDRVDRCPGTYGRPDYAGCEPPDRDADGVEDADDHCPERPETWNGSRDRDGCPDRGAALALARGKQLVITSGRLFRANGALATRGRRAVDVAAGWLQARHARRVTVTVTAPGDDAQRGQTRLRVREHALISRLVAATGLPSVAFTVAPVTGVASRASVPRRAGFILDTP